ncbi:hypothetical protein LE181_31585 [Streptomyces sp. SCA3-4]|uniref:hypothetical protein n=1 Tax=Streptomyces sichuanensis TaxID=2871810 RepID=UPI001CE2C81B|nr:hypothetical protein [Streptomyces sichuanensis]MCA6096687.1 hypothetical protein [Streptomyces sichuanensis]
MSETAGASSGARPATQTRVMTQAPSPGKGEVAHESYAFACMRCGQGWEQSYEIRHYTDAEGRPFVVYYADGERVPSPLSRPTCVNCGEHVVRIMRSGQVSVIADALHLSGRTVVPATMQAAAGPLQIGGSYHEPREAKTRHGRHEAGRETDKPEPRTHGWHLSDLLKPFHRK